MKTIKLILLVFLSVITGSLYLIVTVTKRAADYLDDIFFKWHDKTMRNVKDLASLPPLAYPPLCIYR